MKKYILMALLTCLASATASAAGDLVVNVLGVNSAEGRIRLGLYDMADTFKKENKAITVQEELASTNPVVFKIQDLPAGNYAIHVFHDRDGNENFDHLLGLFPSEGYGFSVNADLKAEESYENSVFTHGDTADTEVAVQMRYCGNRPDKSAAKTFSCWMSLSP